MAAAKDNSKETRRRGAPTKAERTAKKTVLESETQPSTESAQTNLVSELQSDIDNDLDNNIKSNTETTSSTSEIHTPTESIENPVIVENNNDSNSRETLGEAHMKDGDDNAVDNDIPDNDFDPLGEPVVKRSYTATSNTVVNEAPIPEPKLNQQQPFAPQSNGNSTDDFSSDNKKSEKQPKENINPKMDDLSPSQKRKAAEQTADAIITTYAHVVPIPFKKISSFNITKMKKLAMDGKINLDLPILDDGTRVIDYAEGTNKQVDNLFEVTEDMKQEVKEPLIDVLLENNFALTPTQRLLMAVGGHLVTFGVKAVELLQQKSMAMEQFEKFHQDNLAFRRNTSFAATGTQQPTPTPEPNTSATEKSEPIKETPKYTSEKSNKKSDIKMEDILTEENGGIEVSEEPNVQDI
jgi:hypothetical protein